MVDKAGSITRKRKYVDIEPAAINTTGIIDSREHSIAAVPQPPKPQSRDMARSSTQDKVLEAAFEVPLEAFEKIWQRRSSWSEKESQSIIMTIPVEPRVASIFISVPRYKAFDLLGQLPLKEHRIDLE